MDTPEQSTAIDKTQSEDFRNTYANNVQFETSVWDLKIIFGQLTQSIGQNAVVQHTAVTLPWPQVKIMAYLLNVNVVLHEYLNGRIKVPGGILPTPEAIKMTAEGFQQSDEMIAVLLQAYEAFVKDNPEATKPLLVPKPKKK